MFGVAHTHTYTQKHTQNNIPKHFSQRGGGKHMCDMRAKQKKRIFIHLFFPTVLCTYTLVIHTHTLSNKNRNYSLQRYFRLSRYFICLGNGRYKVIFRLNKKSKFLFEISFPFTFGCVCVPVCTTEVRVCILHVITRNQTPKKEKNNSRYQFPLNIHKSGRLSES